MGGWTPPLDTLPSAFAATGLCRLYTSYTGSLVRLRRASDNAEQDFSAAANGWVDPVAVAAWAGGDAFVVTRYDQTANGHDITQATAANQAKIATHCRSMINDGSNDTAAMASSLAYAQNAAGLTFGAVAISSVVSSQALFQSHTASGGNRFRVVRLATGNFAMQWRMLDAEGGSTTMNTPSDMGSIWHRMIARRDYAGALGTLVLDGVSLTAAQGSAGSTSNTAASVPMAVGSDGAGSTVWNGEKSAQVWFQSALSDPNMALLDAALTPIYDGVLAVQ